MNSNRSRVIFSAVFFLASFAHACRYTVREIGFSQAAYAPYRLYVPMPDDLSKEEIEEAQIVASAALGDANIEPVIRHKRQLDSLFRDKKNELLITSPQSRTLRHPFVSSRETWKEDLWDALDWACFSPVRKKINEQLAASFCVLLYLPGRTASENASAEKIIETALAEIKKIIPSMPKSSRYPPTLLTLSAAEQKEEDLLLWSLNADTSHEPGPRAAILYGRARRLGPVLEKEKLNRQNLLNLMALVGADCECGLDRSWILGAMLPCRWGEAMQQSVADDLGFDVENPAIRLEMEQILSINNTSTATNSDFLTGYREGIVDLMTDTQDDTVSTKQFWSPIYILMLSLLSAAGLSVVAVLALIHKKKKKL